MYKISDKIMNFISKAMKSKKMELEAEGQI